MRIVTLTLLLCLCAACAYGNQPDPVADAEQQFRRGAYREGLAVLTKAHGDPALTPEQHAGALQAFARFYEGLVGNHAMALNFYQKLLDVNIPDEHPGKQFARQESRRLLALEQTYAAQDQLLRTLQGNLEILDAYSIDEHIDQLHALIDAYPDYYKLPEAFYTLGISYLARHNYRQAIVAFQKVLTLKPAIDIYYLAVTPQIQIAYKEWGRTLARRFAWGTLTILGMVSAALFYAACPWRWVRWRHLAVGIGLTAGWWGLFTLTALWLSSNFIVPDHAFEALRTRLPSLVRAASGSPGSDILRALFLYSLVGLGGTFIFAIGLSRLKWRRIACGLNAIVGFLFVTASLTVFYLRYCDDHGEFIPATNQGVVRYLNGAVYLHPINPAPYILTDPAAYADLEIMDLTQADFGAAGDEQSDLLQWIIKRVD